MWGIDFLVNTKRAQVYTRYKCMAKDVMQISTYWYGLDGIGNRLGRQTKGFWEVLAALSQTESD